ncbi:translation initiation factor 5A, partial [Lecanoromycetidae sp. Uapishka_2]
MSSTNNHEDGTPFASAPNAGASLTYPLQMSALRKGGYVLIKSHPCKISYQSTSKPGKHGHAKVNIEAYDIFTHQKLVDSGPAYHNVGVPVVVKKEYLLLHIANDGFLSLFAVESGEMREDVRMPDAAEVKEKIEKLWKGGRSSVSVVVLAAMGMDMVVEAKEIAKNEG